MEFVMRLARRRAGWALTAAGTFGLTVAAAAHGLVDQAVAATPPVNASTALDGSLARLIEIRVELAWLADSQTFPYELAARATGATLEVGGQAPNGMVRDQALQIAREQSGLPVVDRLLIQPGTGNPSIKMADANLCHAAGEALGRMLAGHSEPFQVSADPSGQITLLGTVPSCEEKLRISRRMSQLPGCTSVVNSMVVARAMYDGQVYTPVSADGSSVVAGDPLDLLPPPAAAPSPQAQAVAQVPSQQITPEALSYAAGTAAAAARLRPVPANPAPGMATGQPVQYQVVAMRPVSPYAGGINNAAYQYLVPAAMAANAAGVQQVVYMQGNPTLTAAPMPAQQARSSYAQSSYAPSYPRSSYAPTTNPILLASATVPDYRYNDGRAPVAGGRIAPTPARNIAAPPARMQPTREAEKPAEPAKPVTPLTPNQAHIKRLIEAACGDAAQDVALKSAGDNRLTISLRVRSAGEGQHLGERILMMPELEPYKVELAMEVRQ
jgi:hypothetical protein